MFFFTFFFFLFFLFSFFFLLLLLFFFFALRVCECVCVVYVSLLSLSLFYVVFSSLSFYSCSSSCFLPHLESLICVRFINSFSFVIIGCCLAFSRPNGVSTDWAADSPAGSPTWVWQTLWPPRRCCAATECAISSSRSRPSGCAWTGPASTDRCPELQRFCCC